MLRLKLSVAVGARWRKDDGMVCKGLHAWQLHSLNVPRLHPVASDRILLCMRLPRYLLRNQFGLEVADLDACGLYKPVADSLNFRHQAS